MLWSDLRAHRDAWRLHTSEPVAVASGHGLTSLRVPPLEHIIAQTFAACVCVTESLPTDRDDV